MGGPTENVIKLVEREKGLPVYERLLYTLFKMDSEYFSSGGSLSQQNDTWTHPLVWGPGGWAKPAYTIVICVTFHSCRIFLYIPPILLNQELYIYSFLYAPAVCVDGQISLFSSTGLEGGRKKKREKKNPPSAFLIDWEKGKT